MRPIDCVTHVVVINPKGYLPALELHDSEVLTKSRAIVELQPAVQRKYLLGDQFTVADAYLFVVTRWVKTAKVELSDYVNLQVFQQRVIARPGVRRA